MQKLSLTMKWRWIRALQFWNHMPIRAQGGVIVFIPIIAVLVSFGFAIFGIINRGNRQDDIERKFTAVRQYSDLLTLMIDAETGERGYILTHRDEFLEPYKKATDEIPGTIANLKQTIEAEPGEKPRLERLGGLAKIQELINVQLTHLQRSQKFSAQTIGTDELYNHLQAGKATMDEIRANISTMQNTEATLLSESILEMNWIRNRDYVVIFIALMIGMLVRVAAFYLFDRGIVRRINRVTANLDLILQNRPAKVSTARKTDAIGMLEAKVMELSDKTGLIPASPDA